MKNIDKWFWGLFFILGGAAVIINQLGYLGGVNLYTMVVTIFLVAIFIKSVFTLAWWGMLFPVAITCILYSEQLGIEKLTPWPVLIAALLGSIGLSIIFHKKSSITCFGSSSGEHFDTIINEKDENNFTFNVSFGSSIKYVNSEALERADISCNFGAAKVYFDNAKLSKKGAIININTSFAGVELYIPKEWNVINDMRTSLGGVEEKNRRTSEKEGPVVTLTGGISLSGIEIYYI